MFRVAADYSKSHNVVVVEFSGDISHEMTNRHLVTDQVGKKGYTRVLLDFSEARVGQEAPWGFHYLIEWLRLNGYQIAVVGAPWEKGGLASREEALRSLQR